MPALALFLTNEFLAWVRQPRWWRSLAQAVRVFVLEHQTGGLFFVIFFESACLCRCLGTWRLPTAAT